MHFPVHLQSICLFSKGIIQPKIEFHKSSNTWRKGILKGTAQRCKSQMGDRQVECGKNHGKEDKLTPFMMVHMAKINV